MTGHEVGKLMRELGYSLQYDSKGRWYIHRPGDPEGCYYTTRQYTKDHAWQKAIAKYRRENGL